MPFEIGKTINRGAEWLCDSSLIFGTLSNPVCTALLITALALIIIYVIYKESLKGTGWRRGVKAGIWVAIGVSALVFIHYYALERHLRKSHASQGVRDVMASIHHSAATGGGYSVYSGATAAPAADADADDDSGGGDAPRLARSCPDVVGPTLSSGMGAMDELGLQRVVLASTPGGGRGW